MIILLLALGMIRTQTFDVASIHRVIAGGDEGGRDRIERTPSSLTMRNVTLRTCVQWAYGLQSFQVTGPAWTSSERYDLLAKTAPGVSQQQLRAMLQVLLAERFKLTSHHEKKEMQVYTLVIGKNGHKLKPSEDEGEPLLSPGRINVVAKRMPLSEYADLLSGPLRMPVVDMTGLTGRFDFTVNLEPYLPASTGEQRDMGDVVRDAFRDQLGLVLRLQKMPVEIIVIDGANKIPTEN